jgi:hypothetical protein
MPSLVARYPISILQFISGALIPGRRSEQERPRSGLSCEFVKKTHKISPLEDDKRKFLRQKFWSQGNFLGYLGPGS